MMEGGTNTTTTSAEHAAMAQKRKTRKHGSHVANRYLSSILTDRPNSGSVSTKHTAKTANTSTSFMEDELFVEHPRAPRHSPVAHHQRGTPVARSPPLSRRRTRKLQQEEKKDDTHDSDSVVEQTVNHPLNESSMVDSSAAESVASRPEAALSATAFMDKGIEMILASTSCAPTHIDPLQQSPPTKLGRRKQYPTGTGPLPQATRDKFQSVQARFWNQNVSRQNIAAPSKVPRGRPLAHQYPLSPTQSELTGAPTEIATNCAADVELKRHTAATNITTSADEETLESFLCLSPYEKAAAGGGEEEEDGHATATSERGEETQHQNNNASTNQSGNDLSLPSLDEEEDVLAPAPTPMQRRTFTVVSSRTTSSEQAPDPIFASKSFQGSSTSSHLNCDEGATAAAPQVRRTIDYEAPSLLELSQEVQEESNITPIERLRSERASQLTVDPPGEQEERLPPLHPPLRRSITDAWNQRRAQHQPGAAKTRPTTTTGRQRTKATSKPPEVKELIDDGASVGVQSIRSIFEPKQACVEENNGNENDACVDDDTTSVKSLRELFEGSRTLPKEEALDDAGSVKSLRGHFEPPLAKHPKHSSDAEVGRLRALFGAKEAKQTPTKGSPPKATNPPKPHNANKMQCPLPRPTEQRGSLAQKEEPGESLGTTANSPPSPIPHKRFARTKAASPRVLGYWQEKSLPNDQSSEKEMETADSKLQGSTDSSSQTSQRKEPQPPLDPPALEECEDNFDEVPAATSSSMSMTSSQRSGEPAWMGHRDKVLSRHSGSIGNSFLSFEGNNTSFQHSSTMSSPKRHMQTPTRPSSSARLDTSYHQSPPPRVVESSDSESESSDFSDGVTLDASIAEVSVLTDPTGVVSSRFDARDSPTPLSEKVSRNVRINDRSTKQSEASSSQPTEAAAPLIANILRRMPFSDDYSAEAKSRETPVKRVWSQSSDWETTASSVGRNVAYGYGPLNDDGDVDDECTGWDLHRVDAIFPVSPSQGDSGLKPLDVWEVFGSSNSWSDLPVVETPPTNTPHDSTNSPSHVRSYTTAKDEAQTPTSLDKTPPPSEGRKLSGNRSGVELHSSPESETQALTPLAIRSLHHRHLTRLSPHRDLEASVCDTTGSEISQSSLSSRVAKALQRRREAKERERAASDSGFSNREHHFSDEVQSISTTPLSLVAQAARWRKNNASRSSEPASQAEESMPLSPPKRSGSMTTRDFYSSDSSAPQSPTASRTQTEPWDASTPTRTNTTSALRNESSRTVSDFPLFLLNVEENEHSSPKQPHPPSSAGSSTSVQSGASAPSPQRRKSLLQRSPGTTKSVSYSTSLVGVPGHHDATTNLPKYAALRTRLRSLRASRLRRTVAKSSCVASPKGVVEEQLASHRRLAGDDYSDGSLRIISISTRTS